MDARVLFHSSIRIEAEKIMYFDPYKISGDAADADIIFITHDHYDHYSEEDIRKVMKNGTLLVVPESLKSQAEKLAGADRVITVKPGDIFDADGIKAEAVAAYNVGKQFHPKDKNWVGYVVTAGGKRYYIAGDTDMNEDNVKVKCDAAFVPIGGHYTMDASEAAELVNKIKPAKAVPTHYGDVAGRPEDAKMFAAKVNKDIEVEVQLKFK